MGSQEEAWKCVGTGAGPGSFTSQRSTLGTVLLYKGPCAIQMFSGSPLAPVMKEGISSRDTLASNLEPSLTQFLLEEQPQDGYPACLHPVEVCFKPKATSCLHQQVQKRSKARAGEFRGQELRIAIQPPCHGRVEERKDVGNRAHPRALGLGLAGLILWRHLTGSPELPAMPSLSSTWESAHWHLSEL